MTKVNLVTGKLHDYRFDTEELDRWFEGFDSFEFTACYVEDSIYPVSKTEQYGIMGMMIKLVSKDGAG